LPGTSGVLSPFSKIQGLYFDESKEPDDFMYDFKNDMDRILSSEDVEHIQITTETKEDYYRLLDELQKFNKDSMTVYGVSKDKCTVIVENEENSTESTDTSSK
jgi:hypothetical protein